MMAGSGWERVDVFDDAEVAAREDANAADCRASAREQLLAAGVIPDISIDNALAQVEALARQQFRATIASVRRRLAN